MGLRLTVVPRLPRTLSCGEHFSRAVCGVRDSPLALCSALAREDGLWRLPLDMPQLLPRDVARGFQRCIRWHQLSVRSVIGNREQQRPGDIIFSARKSWELCRRRIASGSTSARHQPQQKAGSSRRLRFCGYHWCRKKSLRRSSSACGNQGMRRVRAFESEFPACSKTARP